MGKTVGQDAEQGFNRNLARIALLATIQTYCVACGDGTRADRRRCPIKWCHLYNYRQGECGNTTESELRAAIRKHCNTCMCSERGASACGNQACLLHHSRLP